MIDATMLADLNADTHASKQYHPKETLVQYKLLKHTELVLTKYLLNLI